MRPRKKLLAKRMLQKEEAIPRKVSIETINTLD
jgi:hypothetical protein